MFPIIPQGAIAGVDVSQHNGPIDVQALQDNGCAFLYARATDGLHDVDKKFHSTAEACVKYGLPFGAYGVIEPYGAIYASRQATHFTSVVDRCGATLPARIDLGPLGNLRPIDVLDSAVTWCDVVEEKLGCMSMVCTSPAFAALLERSSGELGAASVRLLARRLLAVAHYGVKSPTVPAPWTDWTIWQRAGVPVAPHDSARLPWSPNGYVDADLFRGTVEQLIALGKGSVQGVG